MAWYIYLLLLVFPLLDATKVAVQSYFSKGRVNTPSDALYFNGFIFLVTTLVSAVVFLREIPTIPTVIAGVAFGLSAVAFQTFYVMAFSTGPVGLTSTVANCSLFIPIVFGIFLYNEQPSVFNYIGIFLVFVALVLIPNGKKSEGGKGGLKWFLLACLTMIFNGICGTVQLVCSKTEVQANLFIVVAYVSATFFAFLVGFILKKVPTHSETEEPKHCFSFDKSLLLGAFIIALTLCIYNYYIIIVLEKYFASYIFYPIANSLTLVFANLTGILFYKEKLNIKQAAGILVTIAAVILIGI